MLWVGGTSEMGTHGPHAVTTVLPKLSHWSPLLHSVLLDNPWNNAPYLSPRVQYWSKHHQTWLKMTAMIQGFIFYAINRRSHGSSSSFRPKRLLPIHISVYVGSHPTLYFFREKHLRIVNMWCIDDALSSWNVGEGHTWHTHSHDSPAKVRHWSPLLDNPFPTEIRQHYAESFHRPVLVEYMSKPHQPWLKMTAITRATIINYKIESPSGTKTSLLKKHHFWVRIDRLPPPWSF